MKTVSYELALRLKEVADKHGVVLPNASSCWMCDDLGRWYMHIGVHWKNNFDFASLPAHTADELMDWFRTFLRIEISACNDLYYVYPNKSFLKMSDLLTIGDTVKSNKILADALAQMAIWFIENGYVKGEK